MNDRKFSAFTIYESVKINRFDRMLFDKNAKQVDKYMCEACGLIKFVVDGHISQLNYCSECGRRILWRNDSEKD